MVNIASVYLSHFLKKYLHSVGEQSLGRIDLFLSHFSLSASVPVTTGHDILTSRALLNNSIVGDYYLLAERIIGSCKQMATVVKITGVITVFNVGENDDVRALNFTSGKVTKNQ